MRVLRATRFLLLSLLLWSGWACTETLVSVVDVAFIEIDPPAPALSPGESVQLTARMKDADGNTLSGRTVQWSSGSQSIATVSSTGMVLGVATGNATIIATSEGVQGNAHVTVGAAPIITAVPDSVPLSAILGESDIAAAAVAITNTGGGTLAGLSAAIEYDAGTTAWLSAELSAEAAPATLALTADASGLARGTHRATVRLTSSATGTAPATVRVVLDVRQRTAAPTLVSVTPDRSAREQSLSVILTGSNFVPGLTAVDFGSGVAVNSVTVDGPTTLTAGITVGPSAAVGQRDVTVTNPPPGGGSAVLAGGFTVEGLNPRPTVTSIEPASAQQQSTLDVQIHGTGFLDDITIADLGTGITINSVDVTSATTLLANITITAGAALGARDVTVVNPEPGGGVGTLRNAFTVLAANPAPTLLSVAPASAQRLTSVTVQLTGTQFATGLTSVDFGAGITVSDMVVTSATTITADITVEASAVLGARAVSVTNAGPGGGTARLDAAFTVLDAHPAPAITSISPATGRPGTTLDVAVAGSGFVSDITTVGFGAGVTVADVSVTSGTALTAAIGIAADAVPGPRSITVSNPAPGGGTATLADAFVVVGAVSPALSTVTAAPSSNVAADGVASASVTVVVRDIAGSAVSGLGAAAFDVTVTGNAVTGAISETTTPGTYLLGVTNTVAETVTVSVAVEGVELEDQPQIAFVATIVSAANSSVTAAPLTGIPADGVAASVVTVVLRDPNDNVLAGLPATAFAIGASGSAVAGAVTETTIGGTYSFAVTNTVAEQVTVSVSAGGTALGEELVLTFVAGGGSAAHSTAVVPNGTAGLVTTLTITVRDANDNLVPGAAGSITVTVTGVNSATPVVSDNGDGTYAASYTPLVAGQDNVAITIGGVALAGSPFASTVVAGAATQMAVSAGDGQSAPVGTPVTIAPSVIVRDATGNPVSGEPVTFAVASGGGSLSSSGVVSTNAAGIATSPTWTLGSVAGSNTLTATSSGLDGSPVTFTASATAGAATQLSITTQPSAAARSGSALAQQPVIQLRDGSGNAVAEAGVLISAAIASGGGVLGGTLTATTDAAGSATFADLSIAGTVGERTLEFSAAGVAVVTSDVVTVSAGDAAQMAISAGAEQSATVGTAVGTAPSVLVADGSGNPVGGIAVMFAVATGGGSLAGDGATVSNVAGIATSPAWTLGTTAGVNTLSATSTGLSGSPLTFTATGTSGDATQMSIITQPSETAQSGAPFARQPSVQIQDDIGNVVHEAGIVVTATIASGGGTLGGTASAATNADGIATFTNLSITGAAGDRTLQFAAGGITPVTSTAISVSAGSATQVSITTQPSATAQSGLAFVQQPVIRLLDSGGNAAAVPGVVVTAAIATGGGVLGGTTTAMTDVDGIAAFSDLSISGIAGTRTLSFASAGLTSAVSTSIAVSAGTATQIAANSGNGQSAPVGTPVPFAPSVIVRDASGNPVAGQSVTFAVTAGNGTLAASGTVMTGASGTATSPAWTLGDAAGVNTLTATAADLAGSPVEFTATGTPGGVAQLTITAQPGASAQSGVILDPQPIIQLHDEFGNAVPEAGVAIVATIASGGGILGGTTTALTDAAGAAIFSDLMVTGLAGDRTLRFTVGTASVVSSAIAITAGVATQIAVNAGNGQSATVGTAVAVAPSVIVADASGNPVAGVSVAFAIGLGGGSLAPTGAVLTNASGIAASPAWTLGTAVGENTLTATSDGLTGSPVTFTATGTAGNAAALRIVTQPSATAPSGGVFAQQPAVQLIDGTGNAVAEAGVVISAGIATGSGTLGGVGTASTDADGIATFAGLSITGLVGDYTLEFSGSGLTSVTSTAIAITTGSAASIAVNAGDGQEATAGGTVAAAPSVIVRDGGDNPVAGAGVTFAIGLGGGSLTGDVTVATDAAGIATSPAWTLGATAGENTLTATSDGLTGSPVTFTATGTAGEAAALVITTEPPASSASGAVLVPQPAVQLQDANGNVVAEEGVTITAAIETGGGTLGGVVTASTDAGGTATFIDLSISGLVGDRTLVFSSPDVTSATSAVITITTGSAASIAVNAGDGQEATAGSTVAAAPSAIVRDGGGNPVAGVSVTFAIASGGGSLTGDVTVATDAAGIATSPAWTLGATAGPNTLTATSDGLTGSPVTFTATGTAGPAARLVITTEPPASSASGAVLVPQPVARIQDEHGNGVAQPEVTVTATLTATGAVLSGESVVTEEDGTAAFENLTITGSIGDYSIELTAADLAPDTTLAITLTAGPAAAMTLTSAPPETVTSGDTFADAVTLEVRDGSNNPVVGAQVTVVVSPDGALGGITTTTTDSAGIATFSGLSITGTAGLRTLEFTTPGLEPLPVSIEVTDPVVDEGATARSSAPALPSRR